jgi:hypothetical protein
VARGLGRFLTTGRRFGFAGVRRLPAGLVRFRALRCRPRAALAVVFFRRRAFAFVDATFRFTRRVARAALRLGRAVVLRFAGAFLFRPFFAAARFVVFRFIAVSSSGDSSWPPRTTGPATRASYGIPFRFPMRPRALLAWRRIREAAQLAEQLLAAVFSFA